MKKIVSLLVLVSSSTLFAGEIDAQRDRYHKEFQQKESYVKLSAQHLNEYDMDGSAYAVEGGLVTKAGMFVAGFGRENVSRRCYAFPYILPDTADIDKYDSKKIDLDTLMFGWGIDTDRAGDNSLVQKFANDYQFKFSIGWGRRQGKSEDYENPGSRRQDGRSMPIDFFMRKKSGSLEGLRFALNHSPYRFNETSYSYDYNAMGMKLWEYKKDTWFTGRKSGGSVELPVHADWDLIVKYNQNRIKEYSHDFSEHENTLGIFDVFYYYPDFGQSSLLRRWDFGLRHYFDTWALTTGIIVHDGSTWAAADAADVDSSESLGLFIESRINGAELKNDRVIGLSVSQVSGESQARTFPHYGTAFTELGTANDWIRRRAATFYYRTFRWDLELSYTQRYDRSAVSEDPPRIFTLNTNTWDEERYGAKLTYRYSDQWTLEFAGHYGTAEAIQHYPDNSVTYNTMVHHRNYTTSDLGLSITRRF